MFNQGQHAPPPYPGQGQMSPASHTQPTTPMFVAPPPKTQRVLHSEAYLKYIEGLNSESATVSKWDQTLKGGLPNMRSFFLNETFIFAHYCQRLFNLLRGNVFISDLLSAQQREGEMPTSPKNRRAGCQLIGWRAKEPTLPWPMHCGACVTWCCEIRLTLARHTTCRTHKPLVTHSLTVLIMKWTLERMIGHRSNIL